MPVLCVLSLLALVGPPGAGAQIHPPADTLVAVRPGESLSSIAARFLERSAYYSTRQLVERIREYNDLSTDSLSPGQPLRVPLKDGKAAAPAPGGRDFVVRGIYINAQTAGSDRFSALVERLVAAGGNTIVFDVKDTPGDLSYVSRVPLAVEIGAGERATLKHPARFVAWLHRRGLYAVARLSCFYDARLAAQRPELMPLSKLKEGPWYEKGEPGWVDPALPQVQEYLLDLVEEVAAAGVDEIQLDYLRFPTEGDVDDALFAFDPQQRSRHEIIAAFLRRVRARLGRAGVRLSVDSFGVAAWGRAADIASTGQKLSEILPYLDAISPMLYPSHFYGHFGRTEHPAAYPYYMLYQGCRHLRRLAAAQGVAVRPWIQAFPYRAPGFDLEYITEQLHGAEDGGARGWLLWHPASRYEVGLAAIERFVHRGAPADSLRRQKRFPPEEPAGGKALGARIEAGEAAPGPREKKPLD